MKKHELFIAACKVGRWKWRSWRISLFSPTRLPKEHDLTIYDIDYRKDGVYYYTEAGEWEMVTDGDPTQALYNATDRVMFQPGDAPNLTEEVESTYGRVLFNWLVITYAFGTKLPFQQKVKADDVVAQFIDKVVDDPEDLADADTTSATFYAFEVARFVKAMFELTSMCAYLTPTGSSKTLTTHPDMIATRNALLIKYKDKLDDPATVALIQNALIELDKEWLKGDSAEGYYISGKSYSVKRKKLFVMHGIEAAFREDGKYELIPTSLSEGWDMTQLVAKYNATREGSYNRGADTALGGEKVTFLQRIFQHVAAVDGDCGTKHTHKLILNEANYNNYIGMNIVDGTKLVQINKDTKDKYLDKMVSLRRPILCKEPGINYCAACLGESLAKSPRVIAAEISAVGSTIMYAFMGAMHGVELSVSHYDYNKHLN